MLDLGFSQKTILVSDEKQAENTPSKLAPRPSGAPPEVPRGRPATCSPEGYTPDPDGPGCTCQECGHHFGTVAGWRYHITGKRCTPMAKAAD
jgi:hypothetical protein